MPDAPIDDVPAIHDVGRDRLLRRQLAAAGQSPRKYAVVRVAAVIEPPGADVELAVPKTGLEQAAMFARSAGVFNEQYLIVLAGDTERQQHAVGFGAVTGRVHVVAGLAEQTP